MKRAKFTTLLLALVMTVAAGQAVWANDYTAEGGTYEFDGTDIVATGTTSITDQIGELVEPGDTVTIELTYTNATSDTTYWYMENTVIKTLEESADMNGGYTYKLTNVGPDGTETEIFNSEAVGGVDAPSGAGTGLEQATTATEGEYESQDYFFIQELTAKQSGKTLLEVGLDPESQINSYQDKDAEIEISYAVELENTEDVYNHIRKTVKTGDENRILLPAICFFGSLLLLILAVWSYRKDRKDRKDGDRA